MTNRAFLNSQPKPTTVTENSVCPKTSLFARTRAELRIFHVEKKWSIGNFHIRSAFHRNRQVLVMLHEKQVAGEQFLVHQGIMIWERERKRQREKEEIIKMTGAAFLTNQSQLVFGFSVEFCDFFMVNHRIPQINAYFDNKVYLTFPWSFQSSSLEVDSKCWRDHYFFLLEKKKIWFW